MSLIPLQRGMSRRGDLVSGHSSSFTISCEILSPRARTDLSGPTLSIGRLIIPRDFSPGVLQLTSGDACVVGQLVAGPDGSAKWPSEWLLSASCSCWE